MRLGGTRQLGARLLARLVVDAEEPGLQVRVRVRIRVTWLDPTLTRTRTRTLALTLTVANLQSALGAEEGRQQPHGFAWLG